MNVPNVARGYEPAIGPANPIMWNGVNAVDGDAQPWLSAPVGSVYFHLVDGENVVQYVKNDAAGNDYDWTVLSGCITETISYSDFTDGGAAVGTYTMQATIPVGAYVTRAYIVGLTGFTGDTSATIQVGDGSDADRYSTGTPSVFTTAVALDLGAPSGTQVHIAAKTPVVTVTSGSDWGAVTAGQMTLRIFFTR